MSDSRRADAEPAGTPQERVAELTRRMAAAAREIAWFGVHRDRALRQMRAEGASYARVAAVCGLSRSRAQQLCQRLEREGPVVDGPLDREQVRTDLLAHLPPAEVTPQLVEELLDLVMTGSAEERAAAITRRAADATRTIAGCSARRDTALREMLAAGATTTDVAAALGVSRTWSTALLRRLHATDPPG